MRLTNLTVFLFTTCVLGQGWASAEDYAGFAALPEPEKDQIVWQLHEPGHKWGLPEQKPICRDLLLTQGYSSFANNATAWTTDAIDLAETRGWKDLSPLITKIYERPINIWVLKRAFCYIRNQSGKPVSTNVLADAETLRAAGKCRIGNDRQLQFSVSDEQLSAAKERLLLNPDKEAVLVCTLEIAGWNAGKSATDRGRKAAADVLKSLDPNTVIQRINQLRQDANASTKDLLREECDWIFHYLGISLASGKQ